jgi:hypothetical protein
VSKGSGTDPRSSRRPRNLLKTAIVGALLLNAAVQMILATREDAPTFDEPFHIGAAVQKNHGELQWGADHPPFAQLLIGLPLRLHKFGEPAHDSEAIDHDAYVRGKDLMYQGGEEHASRVLLLARLPIMAATLATLVVVFLFAQHLFGGWAGVLALVLASANPSVLAHGGLATTDMVLSGLLLTAVWAICRSYPSGSLYGSVAAASVIAGLALATKFTALPVIPVLAMMILWVSYRRRPADRNSDRASWLTLASLPLAFVVVSVAMVWFVFLLVDPELEYRPRVLEAPSGLMERVATQLPMPETYRDGLRLQIQWDQAGRASFLFGEKYIGGKLIFYPAVLLMKSPIPLLLGFMAGLITWLRSGRSRSELLMILAAPAALLAFAMSSGTNLGIRHVLLAPLIMAVVAGGAAAAEARSRTVIGAVLSIWALGGAWLSFPSHLAYINEAFGGSDNAYRLVGDSNVDWGQDLVRLRNWLHANPTSPVWLAYFGQAPVEEYGLDVLIATPGDIQKISGTFAVSVSALNNAIPGPYDSLVAGRTPFAQIGHSILLYDLPVRRESGHEPG